jgi:DNA polymerase delta subunit 2
MTGRLGDGNCQKAAQIVKIIVAGNLIGKNVRKEEEEEAAGDKTPFSWTRKTKPHTLEPVQMIDDYLTLLGTSIDVDIMPGPFDPTSHLLPQQPLHPCILPKSSLLTSIRSVTNPYAASFDGVRFLGTSGQTVSNIMEYSTLEEPVDILEKTLNWGHLAPTAPDTLHSYPYPDKDPFVVKYCPHVYFAGNQSEFNTKLMEGPKGQKIRLIAVPDFEEKTTCVTINLRTLECELMAFD